MVQIHYKPMYSTILRMYAAFGKIRARLSGCGAQSLRRPIRVALCKEAGPLTELAVTYRQ